MRWIDITVLIDTGVFVAFHNIRDENHEAALRLISAIACGEMGPALTTDYVFDESVTVTLIRTRRPELAISLGKLILGETTPPFIEIARVNVEQFKRAWSLFGKYSGKGLSFTDCTSLAVMDSRSIDKIASFDSGFEGIITRVS